MAKKNKFPFDDENFYTGGLSVDEPITESVYIDMEEINRNAKNDSLFMLKDLAKIYGNERFMAEHPEYKKRLDLELESIRVLLKMRRSDEITHDILVKQIGLTPNVAGMYTALQKIQSAMVAIENKLDEKVRIVNGLLKNYQMELPFDQPEEVTTEEQSGESSGAGRYRGTKAFIMDMNKQPASAPEEQLKSDPDMLPNQLELFADGDLESEE